MKPEQERLDELAVAMKVYQSKRGADGEYVIEGERGNIHCDGAGFSVYCDCKRKRAVSQHLSRLSSVLTPKQTGDTEFVAYLCGLPIPPGLLADIRKILAIPRKYMSSPAQLANIQAHKFAPKSV